MLLFAVTAAVAAVGAVVWYPHLFGPFKSIANSGGDSYGEILTSKKKTKSSTTTSQSQSKMVLSLMFVENQRHRNRKLYAVKRMTCVLDLSCQLTSKHINTHTHTHALPLYGMTGEKRHEQADWRTTAPKKSDH